MKCSTFNLFYIQNSRIFILVSLLLLISISVDAKNINKQTDDLNRKLRTVDEKGEMDEQKASVAEVLVSKNEAKAMEQINKLLSKYRNTPLEPSLLFRKAELFIRQSKSARFFEFNRTDKFLTLLPTTVRNSSSQSKLKQAVDIYESIESKYKEYSDLDLVMFNNAYVRQQLDQEKIAEKKYRQILNIFPESFLIPDTHMSLAELLYKNKRFQEALVQYEAIKKYPLARVYTYAIYKTGWTKYQLKDVVGAIKELEEVIKVSEKNLIGEGGNKISLKAEALTDLVLFYPEAYEAKKAFAYFRSLAQEETGQYILQLSQLYENHGKLNDFEIVLNDLIKQMPKSPQSGLAYKSLIEADITQKTYDKAVQNISNFEKHCQAHFSNVKKSVQVNLENIAQENIQDCKTILASQTLKTANKWHKDWQKQTKRAEELKASFNAKDAQKLEQLSSAAQLSYEVYLRASEDSDAKHQMRFNYAELLFQKKNFRQASEQYYIASQSLKDTKMVHQSSYYAIVSLESAAGEKWSDQDEERYLVLASNYIQRNPKGEFLYDVTFKKSFIAYEKSRYDEALIGFKELGWNKKVDAKVALRSQDLYLDILNIQKKYDEIMNASFDLLKSEKDSSRKLKLDKIYKDSFFSYAVSLQEKKDFDKSAEIYEKYIAENSKSDLADEALWNLSQIYIQQNKLYRASDKLFSLYRDYPKTENSKKALEKSLELFEYLGLPEKASASALELSKIDSKNSTKWLRLSADLDFVSQKMDSALVKYTELLKLPDAKMRSEIVAKLKLLKVKSSSTQQLIAKYDSTFSASDTVSRAQKAIEQKNNTLAFKLASEVVGDKSALTEDQALARFIQAQILSEEFYQQSVKSKLDRLEIVLTLKTEKLDKAQRALQSSIRYGVPEVAGKAYLKLAEIYTHYVASLRNIQITEDISEKDKQILLGEIDKIILPIEDKISETLSQGLDFLKKNPSYTDLSYQIQNEFLKINFKPIRLVDFPMSAPEIALPRFQ